MGSPSPSSGTPALVTTSTTAAPARRIAAVDIARGVAIAAMVVYHFAWDLSAFGFIAVDVGFDPWWRLFAHAIATTFLALVGVGIALAAQRGGTRRPAVGGNRVPEPGLMATLDATLAARTGLKLRPYLGRLGRIAAGAAAVSIATFVVEPREFVFFGILHLIAVASVLAVPFLLGPAWIAVAAGIIVVILGNVGVSPLFDAPWLLFLGFSAHVPATVDYYPLFPWFGVVLLGFAAGRLVLASGADAVLARWKPADPASRVLALAGRWSLTIYLLHQVVLYSGVSLAAQVLLPPPPAADPAAAFMGECVPACGAQGKSAATCTAYCGCVYAGIVGTDLATATAASLTDDQRSRFADLTKRCAAASPPSPPPSG